MVVSDILMFRKKNVKKRIFCVFNHGLIIEVQAEKTSLMA